MANLFRRETGFLIYPETESRTDRSGRPYQVKTGRHFVGGFPGSTVDGEIVSFLLEDQEAMPVYLGTNRQSNRHTWVYGAAVYSSKEMFEPHEVRAVLGRNERRLRAVVAAALAADDLTAEPSARRAPIPDDVKVFVWQRDGGGCVRCGSSRYLEFDHIVPVVMGGSDTARNLQLLCESCNRTKGGNLV